SSTSVLDKKPFPSHHIAQARVPIEAVTWRLPLESLNKGASFATRTKGLRTQTRKLFLSDSSTSGLRKVQHLSIQRAPPRDGTGCESDDSLVATCAAVNRKQERLESIIKGAKTSLSFL
ncbi:unnamed protein product, partial [Ectocarpus sp. 12 AP-2014]